MFKGPSKERETLQVVRKRRGDHRLDFFSHLLLRLSSEGRSSLRHAPVLYGNHFEYMQTWLPMIVEDTVSTIPADTVDGGSILRCHTIVKWLHPFYLAYCECSDDVTFHGNELLRIRDDSGLTFWGITKKGVSPVQRELEVLVLAGPTHGSWICTLSLDTNSHMREFAAVQTMADSSLLQDILKKKKTTKKSKEVAEDVGQVDVELNHSQAAAVTTAVARQNGITLIQGPPGTGKTKTIVSIISRLSRDGKPGGILVCAPSNTAVDELTRRLDNTEHGLRIVRVSAFGRGQSCKNVLLQNLAVPTDAAFRARRSIEQKDTESGATDASLQGWHSYEVDELLDKRDAINRICRITEAEARVDTILGADVVLCTLSMAASQVIQRSSAAFRVVIIDEAAQAVEPSTLIPLTYGCTRLVMVGDPCQLPATVQSMDCLEHGYGKSLFERLKEAGTPVHLLDTQYRMHPLIRSFPARYFYEDRLKDCVMDHEDHHHDEFLQPYMLFNVSSGAETVRGTSLCNDAEARFAVSLLPGLGKPVILTAYRAQVDRIRVELAGAHVEVSTIDGFQGREAETVIVSCVRTRSEDGDQRIGFLSDRRRMNVALTRARRTCWVIGNVQTLQSNTDWEELVLDAERRGLLVDVVDEGDGWLLRNRSTKDIYRIHG